MVWMGPIWTPTTITYINMVARLMHHKKTWSCGFSVESSLFVSLFHGISFRFPHTTFLPTTKLVQGKRKRNRRKNRKKKEKSFPSFRYLHHQIPVKFQSFPRFWWFLEFFPLIFQFRSIGFGWICADSVISVRYGAWISVTSWIESVLDQELGFSLYGWRGNGIWLGLGLGFRQIWGFGGRIWD